MIPDTLKKVRPRCCHCKTDRGPPYLRMSLRHVPNFVRNSNDSIYALRRCREYCTDLFSLGFLIGQTIGVLNAAAMLGVKHVLEWLMQEHLKYFFAWSKISKQKVPEKHPLPNSKIDLAKDALVRPFGVDCDSKSFNSWNRDRKSGCGASVYF